MFLKSQKAFLLALEPLRQISADLSKAKDVLALIQVKIPSKRFNPLHLKDTATCMLGSDNNNNNNNNR